MARIQVLELPLESLGEARQTPYILIIDQIPHPDVDDLRQALADPDIQKSCGARTILVFESTMDVA